MNFDSYIISETKTSLSMPLDCPPPRKLKHSKGFKRFAFTLAETLITLTIIGVVAALTVPNLLNKYTKHTYVVGLKKAYAQLQHAVKMIPITEGCSAGDYDCAGMFQYGGYHSDGKWISNVTNIDGQDFWGHLSNKQIYLLSKQFKVKKLCYRDNNCPEANEFFHYGTMAGSFVTQDNMIWGIHMSESMHIDINGFKGPNKTGRDQFAFDLASVTQNGIQQGTVLPRGSKLNELYYDGSYSYWRNRNDCTEETIKNGDFAIYCTGRVLEEDAMNY